MAGMCAQLIIWQLTAACYCVFGCILNSFSYSVWRNLETIHTNTKVAPSFPTKSKVNLKCHR